MKNKKLINWLCLSGVVALIFYILHAMIGAMNYPGYNWKSQALSDLTATDAPSFMIANAYSNIYGTFAVLCCAIVAILIQREKSKALRIGVYLFMIMNFISGFGFSLFPLSSSGFDNSFQSKMHVITLVPVILLSIISLILIAIGSFKGETKHKYLGIFSIISLLCMFAGSIGAGVVPEKYIGIPARFGSYSAASFPAILGIYGFCVFKQDEKDT